MIKSLACGRSSASQAHLTLGVADGWVYGYIDLALPAGEEDRQEQMSNTLLHHISNLIIPRARAMRKLGGTGHALSK